MLTNALGVARLLSAGLAAICVMMTAAAADAQLAADAPILPAAYAAAGQAVPHSTVAKPYVDGWSSVGTSSLPPASPAQSGSLEAPRPLYVPQQTREWISNQNRSNNLMLNQNDEVAHYPDGSITPADYEQSPDFTPIPNPTPIESPRGPPPYTFLPDAPDSESCPNCNTQPRNFILQQRHFTTTWLPAGSDDLGMFDFDLHATFAVPSITGLTITPGMQVHFIDGPTRTDLPPRLYNARVEFSWMKQLDPRFGLQLALTPGVFSDFERSNSDALRVMARVLGFYGYTEQTQLVFGIAYLDREDISVLPAIGVIHVPSEDVRLEIVFPRPKLAYRLKRDGDLFDEKKRSQERWVYLSGEFGGGSWAVERTNGTKDVASYSDWRLILGLETKEPEGPGWHVEVGIVFNRDLEHKSGRGNFEPDATVMLRGGVVF